MVLGPTSRAVGRSEEEEEGEIAVLRGFPYLTLTSRSSDAGIVYG